MPNNNIDDDEPLDPAVEAIRVKMMRLLVVSGGIMVLGLMTVLGAIVYKINQPAEPSAAVSAKAARSDTYNLNIPAGSEVQNSTVSSNSITLTLRLSDGKTAVHVYRSNGQLAAVYNVSEE